MSINHIILVDLGTTINLGEEKKSLTTWLDQLEGGLKGILAEWKVQLERELISIREALRTEVNQKIVAIEFEDSRTNEWSPSENLKSPTKSV